MEGSYPLLLHDQTVGRAVVQKTGLFLHIVCSCNGIGQARYRLFLHSQSCSKDLGLWNGIGKLTIRLPMNQAGTAPLRFCLEAEQKEQYHVVYEHQPFPALSQLEKARLNIRNGQTGILLTD